MKYKPKINKSFVFLWPTLLDQENWNNTDVIYKFNLWFLETTYTHVHQLELGLKTSYMVCNCERELVNWYGNDPIKPHPLNALQI
jgi:hypothetical protein